MPEKHISVPYLDQTGAGAFTGCECVSAVMLLQYLGYDISIDDFLDCHLEKDCFETRDGILYGPDPREVFAGDPRDPEAMGCYAPVICRSLERILGDRYEVINETGAAIPDLLHYLDEDMPVILWSTIDLKEIVIGPSWRLKTTGEEFVWRSNEHCIVLTGYDDERYYFNDSWQNNGAVSCDRALLEDRFRKQHSQAIGLRMRTPHARMK